LADRFGDQSSNSNKYKIRGRLRHQSNVHPLEVARLFSNCLDHIFLECGGRPNKLELCLEEVNNIAQVTFLYSRKDTFLEPKSFAFALASRKAIRLGAWLSQKNIQNKAQMTVSFPRTPNVSRCGLSKKRPAEKFNFRLTAP
jgi:hypothetical protein